MITTRRGPRIPERARCPGTTIPGPVKPLVEEQPLTCGIHAYLPARYGQNPPRRQAEQREIRRILEHWGQASAGYVP
jgi:hypothetical protein